MAITRIDVRPHRRYEFLHDFNLDWLEMDAWNKAEIKRLNGIKKDYFIFYLDFFDHSVQVFSLADDRTDLGYYEFDRAKDIWIIAVMKEDWMTKKMALELARDRIEDYNSWINGRDEGE